MLSAAFLDWWFAPWIYASSPHASQSADLIGRRDAYRLWCADAGVKAALPPAFDAAWQETALDDGQVLTAGACLFGGLLAVRQQRHEALAQLAVADRKWCMSIASLQPLSTLAGAPFTAGDRLEIRGLAELAGRIEHAFPGMWSRLKLLLPPELDEPVTRLLEQTGDVSGAAARDSQRALRCWRLCRQRAGDVRRTGPTIPTNDASET